MHKLLCSSYLLHTELQLLPILLVRMTCQQSEKCIKFPIKRDAWGDLKEKIINNLLLLIRPQAIARCNLHLTCEAYSHPTSQAVGICYPHYQLVLYYLVQKLLHVSSE